MDGGMCMHADSSAGRLFRGLEWSSKVGGMFVLTIGSTRMGDVYAIPELALVLPP